MSLVARFPSRTYYRDPSYTINVTPTQVLQMGLVAGSGQTFQFVGSYISTSAYRSNETIGARVTVSGDGAGNAGFNNPPTVAERLSYTLVPEPTTIGLVLIGLVGLIARHRRSIRLK